jgi:hypothetical protein
MTTVLKSDNLYVSSSYSNFFRTIANYFKMRFFNGRVNNIVISTYEKSVERYNKRLENPGEYATPTFPYITIDPYYDIEPDRESCFGGGLRNHYNFLGIEPSKDWVPKIYEDENLYISAILNRYRSEMDIIVNCSSIYELIDYRTNIYQHFGGIDRILQPTFEGYFIIPNSFVLYQYSNQYTQQEYTLNWDNNIADNYYIKMLGDDKEYKVYPFELKPMIKLLSVSDGSTKYGNPDKNSISDHRFVVNVQWESWIPNHFVLVSNNLPAKYDYFSFEIRLGYQYSQSTFDRTQPITVPIHRLINYASDTTSMVSIDLSWGDNYCYIISESDKEKFDNDESVTIVIPKDITDIYHIVVSTRIGELAPGFHYDIIDTNTIKLIGFNLKELDIDDKISFEIYQQDEQVLE